MSVKNCPESDAEHTPEAPPNGARLAWTDNDGTVYHGAVVHSWHVDYGFDAGEGWQIRIRWDDDLFEDWPWPHVDLREEAAA